MNHTTPVANAGSAFSTRPRILESNTIADGEEAMEYDTMVRRWAWLLNRPFVKLVSRMNWGRGRLLDIGTGPGWIPIELALRNPEVELWAVDASEEMCARARRHAIEAGVQDRVHVVTGNAAELPFDAGEFDGVISHYMLHHIDRPEEILNEAARVTRRGGRVVVKDLLRQSRLNAALLTAFSKYVLRYSEGQLQQLGESMDAALTRAEVRGALRKTTLAGAKVQSFRGLDYVVVAEV